MTPLDMPDRPGVVYTQAPDGVWTRSDLNPPPDRLPSTTFLRMDDFFMPTDEELLSARLETLPGSIVAVPPDVAPALLAFDRPDDNGNVRTFKLVMTPQLRQRLDALRAPTT